MGSWGCRSSPGPYGGCVGVSLQAPEVESRPGDYSTIRRGLSIAWRAIRANEPSVAVKSTGKLRRAACNEPAGNFRLPVLVLLCFAILWLLASCGGEQPATPEEDTPIPEVPTKPPSPTTREPLNPSPTPMPTPTMGPPHAATGLATHAAAQASNSERDSDDGTKVAVQRLFDTWNQALREDDASLFHSLLTEELAGSCGLDELQSWLDQDEEFFAKTEVTAVFLDVADPSRALAEIAARQSAGRPLESISFPWPVALEDGEWRAGFPMGFTANRCPYVASSPPSGPEGREREYPQIPGMDLERREGILDAVPGTRVIRGNIRTSNSGSGFSSGGSMSPYDNQVSIYAEVETEVVAAELVRLYRDGLSHPSWEIIDDDSSGDFGWFSWSVPDGEGRLWHGTLVVAPLHEGWKQVWLSLYSNDADDSR